MSTRGEQIVTVAIQLLSEGEIAVLPIKNLAGAHCGNMDGPVEPSPPEIPSHNAQEVSHEH